MLWQMARLGLVPLRLKAALWLHMQGPENSIAFPVVYTKGCLVGEKVWVRLL
jgi:hypothetical protein